MSDPRIAQLRAKADSTTFPAEAAALRAKADELEAREPKRPSIQGQRLIYSWFDEVRRPDPAMNDLYAKMAATMKEADARFEARRAADRVGRTTVTIDGVVYTKVTGVNGLSYWTRTE